MIKELLEWFDRNLNIEEIRKLENEYEIKTKGWYYSTTGWNIPITTFYHMMKDGFYDIRIIESTEPKSIGLWDLECIVTIRFKVNEETFKEVMSE